MMTQDRRRMASGARLFVFFLGLLAILAVTLQGFASYDHNGSGGNSSGSGSSLKISSSPLPNGQVGVAYTAKLTATGGTQPYTWSVSRGSLPGGLALNATTGVISGTPTQAVSSDVLTFRVKDSSNPPQRKSISLSLTIEEGTPSVTPVSVTTTSLPAATENAAYSQQLAATGGSGSYTWALTTAVSGFSLSSSGLLTGTPTSATALTFDVKVADSTNSSNSATAALKLSVNAATTTPVSITTSGLPAATDNVAYSQQLTATGGSGSYAWTLTTAVSGFSLSSSGLLTGTPTSSSTLTFDVKVTDSSNSSDSATAVLTLTVNATGSGSD
jgi:hypothetical protein